MAIKHYKRISELNAITSASLETYVAGVDNGETVRITLDVLASGVRDTINTLDNIRLTNLENYTASFSIPEGTISSSQQISSFGFVSGSYETTGRNTISSSTQITNLGFISESVDISLLNEYTASQDVLNIAFTNGINARLQTSSFNDFSQSYKTDSSSFDNRLDYLETNLDGGHQFATTGSNTFDGNQWVKGYIVFGDTGQSSVDFADSGNSLVLSANQNLTLNTSNGDIILNADGNVYKGSATAGNGLVTDGYLGVIIGDENRINTGTGHSITDNLDNIINSIPSLNSLNTFSSSYFTDSASFDSRIIAATNEQFLGGFVTTSSFNNYTASISTASLVDSINNLNNATSSYELKGSGIISGSSQLATYFEPIASISHTLVSGSSQILGGSGIISGSSQLTGSFVRNSQTSSMFVGYSTLVLTQNASNNQDYSIVFAPSGSNGYLQTYTDNFSDLLYNPSTNRLKAGYFNGIIEATNGVISGSSQISNLGFSTTSSLNSFTASYLIDSASIKVELNNLELTSASVNVSINNINLTTASLNTSVNNINTFSSSQLTQNSSLAAITGSLITTASNNVVSIVNINSHTGSYATTGSNIFNGTETISGSLFISGTAFHRGDTTICGTLVVSASTAMQVVGGLVISGTYPVGGASASMIVNANTVHKGYVRFDPNNITIDGNLTSSYIFVSGSTNDLYFIQNAGGFNNTTRLRWIEGNMYTGLLNGGLITSQSSTVYQVSSGSGIIVNLNASYTDSAYPTIQYVNWGNLSASIAPLSASYDQTYVAIQSNGTIYAQGTPYNDGQYNSLIPVGLVLHQNHSTINNVKTIASVAYGWKQRTNDFVQAFGPLKLSGFTIQTSGSSGAGITVGSGTAFADGVNYAIDANNPSYAVDSGTNVSKIWRYRQSGSAWIYDTNSGSGYTTLNQDFYNNPDTGVLTAMTNGQWSVQRLFWFPNSVGKAIVAYYGNAVYTSEVEARTNLEFETFTEAPNTRANAIYLGAIAFRGDFVNWTDPARYSIYPGGLFRNVGGSGGGGTVVTTLLSGLSDVLISGPTNNELLAYDSTALKWENKSSNTLGLAITGSNTFYGNQTFSGSLIPTTQSGSFTSSFSLGSPTAAWQHLYVSTGSIKFVNKTGQIVDSISTNDNGINVGNLTANNGITGSLQYSYLVNVPTLVSGSSQLTASFDNRYTLSGSVQPLPDGLISSSTQLTQLNSATSSLYTSASLMSASIVSLQNFNGYAVNYVSKAGAQVSSNVDGFAIISASITTSGRPVQIMVTGDANPTSTSGQWVRLGLYRDSTAIGNQVQVEASAVNENNAYALQYVDNPSAGTYTYYLKQISPAGGTFQYGETAGPVLTLIELGASTTALAVPVGTISGSSQISAFGYATTGSNTFVGNEIINGTLNVSSSFTASLSNGNIWVGNSLNRSYEFPTASLVTTSSFNAVSSSLLALSQSANTTDIQVSSSIATLQASLGATSNAFNFTNVTNPTNFVLVSYLTASYNGGVIDILGINNSNGTATSTNYQFASYGANAGISQNGKQTSGAGAPNLAPSMTLSGSYWTITVTLSGTYNLKGVARLF